MGPLAGIAIKKESRAPIKVLIEAQVDEKFGIIGDWKGDGGKSGKRKRQITVLFGKKWRAACAEACGSHVEARALYIDWRARRANFFVEGIEAGEEDVGKLLYVGNEVILEITGETSLCNRMNEAHPRLKEALLPDWRGGVTCRVVRGGEIKLDDEVHLEPKRESHNIGRCVA